MKLRNKSNGEILEIKLTQTNCECLAEHEVETLYGEKLSLATLNKYYEDCTPAKPLIKDEKIRNAVRAWAELNCSHKLHQHNDYQLEDENNYMIEFADSCFTNLKIGKSYSIAELCGEEEE